MNFPIRRRAFTLVELVLALGISSVLMVSVASAVVIAARALPDSKRGGQPTQREAAALRVLAREASYALTVTERTATALTFTVADRNGDGQPETIRYAWSSTSGSSLTRQYNSGTPLAVASDVRQFSLAYDTKSVQAATPDTESAEKVLFSYDNVLNLVLSGDLPITSTDWAGQYIKPTLASGTTAWRVTRVQFRARTHGAANGQANVQMRKSAGIYPSRTVVAQVSMLENTLTSSYQWKEVIFSNATFTPTETGCFVVQWVSDAHACDVQIGNLSSALSNTRFITGSESTNGTTWSSTALQAMQIYVYGTVTTSNPPTTRYYLTNVRASLSVGSNSRDQLFAGTQVLAEPEVTGP